MIDKMAYRRIILYGTAIIGGLILGVASVFWLVSSPVALELGATQPVVIDDWYSDWAYGTTQSNPYTRAIVARRGLFALPRTQSVYFIRQTDDSGRLLVSSCQYRVTLPRRFPAGWWSITLYDDSGFLPRNDGQAMAVDQHDLSAQANPAQANPAQANPAQADDTILVARTKPDGYDGLFISSDQAPAFDLTLRLYEPEATLLDDPKQALSMPAIRRLACNQTTGGAS